MCTQEAERERDRERVRKREGRERQIERERDKYRRQSSVNERSVVNLSHRNVLYSRGG